MKISIEQMIIAALGINLVYRNSNTVRYFRINLFLIKHRITIDLFTKDKL